MPPAQRGPNGYRRDARLKEIDDLQRALRIQRDDLCKLREKVCRAWERGDCVDLDVLTEDLVAKPRKLRARAPIPSVQEKRRRKATQ